MTSQNERQNEYLELQAMIAQLTMALVQEKSRQDQLGQQIEDYHHKLKEVFAEHWQPLHEKEV